MPQPDLTAVFGALADPTRRAILARLAQGDAPVKDLAEPFALTGAAITKHLKVLEKAGLISRSRDGQLRPCRMEARALEPALDWIEQYRFMWDEQLARLGEYLQSIGASSALKSPTSSTPAQPEPSKPVTKKAKSHGPKK
jgi:DNA-binding transcriptional ArsR family regulator